MHLCIKYSMCLCVVPSEYLLIGYPMYPSAGIFGVPPRRITEIPNSVSGMLGTGNTGNVTPLY